MLKNGHLCEERIRELKNHTGNNVHTKLGGYYSPDNDNPELCVKLPEYYTDNVRQYNMQEQVSDLEGSPENHQSKDAARAAARRRRETTPERKKRLAQSAAHIALKRKMETPDQRRIRLAKDAARTAERRKNESYAEREARLAMDAARHAAKRRHSYADDRLNSSGSGHYHHDVNNNQVYPSPGGYLPPNMGYHPSYPDVVPYDHHKVHHPEVIPVKHPIEEDQLFSKTPDVTPLPGENKYGTLLSVIEDLGREIRPTYAGSKMSQDRLRKGIMHARELVRNCLAEVEKRMR